jgi:hypothetical protein
MTRKTILYNNQICAVAPITFLSCILSKQLLFIKLEVSDKFQFPFKNMTKLWLRASVPSVFWKTKVST